jgi:hypothetical protein
MINITQSPYNCVGDGITDNTSGINAALATGKPIYAPSGNYKTSGNHSIGADGQRVFGDGRKATIFTIASSSNPGFIFASGTIGAGIADVSIVRSGSPSSGAYGISQPAVLEKASIEGVTVLGHYVGIFLTNTDYSIVRDTIVEGSVNFGVEHHSVLGNGQCQWTFEHCLFVKNGNHGYYFQAAPGSSSNSLGEYINLSTFANNGCGLCFLGNSSVNFIAGVRILGGFFGEDGYHEILLDTYGGAHTISSVSAELPGRGLTGPTRSKPPSNVGAGIVITSNNMDVTVVGVRVNGASDDGLFSEAQYLNLSGSMFTNNGAALSTRNGIHIAGGSANVVGNTSGNVNGSTTQDYGLYRSAGATVQNIGNQFMANRLAPTHP